MAMKYADRAFLTVAGKELFDVQSATLKQNRNARQVPSMTHDGRNRGIVEGNLDVDVTFTIAVENQLASPQLDFTDYISNDLSLVFKCGVDTYTATKLYLKDNEESAGGIGDEVKKTYNFGALDVTSNSSNSSLFDVSF